MGKQPALPAQGPGPAIGRAAFTGRDFPHGCGVHATAPFAASVYAKTIAAFAERLAAGSR
jgi:hypothetical protein